MIRSRDGASVLVRCFNGQRYWYSADAVGSCTRKGILHREDGPAIEYANGEKAWFENDQHIRSEYPPRTKTP